MGAAALAPGGAGAAGGAGANGGAGGVTSATGGGGSGADGGGGAGALKRVFVSKTEVSSGAFGGMNPDAANLLCNGWGQAVASGSAGARR
jgi:hypothetical protein